MQLKTKNGLLQCLISIKLGKLAAETRQTRQDETNKNHEYYSRRCGEPDICMLTPQNSTQSTYLMLQHGPIKNAAVHNKDYNIQPTFICDPITCVLPFTLLSNRTMNKLNHHAGLLLVLCSVFNMEIAAGRKLSPTYRHLLDRSLQFIMFVHSDHYVI